MSKSVFMAIIIAMGVLCQSAMAFEPFSDPSGLVQAPQANMNPEGLFSVGFNYAGLNITDKTEWQSKYDRSYSNVNLQMALLPFLQIGGASVLNNKLSNDFGGEAKLQLLGEHDWIPAIAIGANNIGITDKDSMYAVASKQILPGTSISLGMGTGVYKSHNGGRFEELNGLLAGVRQNLGPVALFAELSGAAVNAGTSIQLGKNMNLNIAAAELQDLASSKTAPNNKARVIFGLNIGEIFYGKDNFTAQHGNAHIYTAQHVPEDEQSSFAATPKERDKAIASAVAERDKVAALQLQKAEAEKTAALQKADADKVAAVKAAREDVLAQVGAKTEAGLAAKVLTEEQQKQAEKVVVPKKQSELFKVTTKTEKVRKMEKVDVLLNTKKVITLGNVKGSGYKGLDIPTPQTAAERTAIIIERLNKLIAEDKLMPLTVETKNDYYVGMSSGEHIFTVTAFDAAMNKTDTKKLCEKWVESINKVIEAAEKK